MSLVFAFAGAFVAVLAASTPIADGAAAPVALGPGAAGAVRYGRDVRPILSDRCFVCHGADEGSRKAELRLDEREFAVAGRDGNRAGVIVPGDAEGSELWHRLTATDPDNVMPPPHANKRPLSDAELGTIRRWIEEGAAYEEHWSFVPPARSAPPAVRDAAWPRDDIDRFVLAELERRGVSPSPEADRATLLRRVYLDLTGLPPTPEQVEAFIADPAPDAYERRVQEIFENEPQRSRMAERLASPWLDAARYADTCGIHTDNGRQMWLWRDWVLAALRDNMPYDRFLTEQLAGDLVPGGGVAAKIASGFNRNHVTTDEGGAIAEEYLVEYAVDRVSTTGTVFLGLTLGCARCHDHKYDPISQGDFYSLLAFFNSVEEPGLYTQTADANRAYEPFIEVPTAEQSAALDELNSRLAALRAGVDEPAPGELAKAAEFADRARESAGVVWSVPEVLSAASTDPSVTLGLQEDGSVLASGPMPEFEDYSITLRTAAAAQRLVLIEALPSPGSGKGAGRAEHGNAVITGITLDTRAAAEGGAESEWTPVGVRWAWADHSQRNRDFEVINTIDPDDGLGWAADGNEAAGSRVITLLTDAAFGAGSADGEAKSADVRVTVRFRSEYRQHALGRVRVRFGSIDGAGAARLPVALGRWYAAGPFRADTPDLAYTTPYGPEEGAVIDRARNFGAGNLFWTFDGAFADGRVVPLADGVGAHYVGRTLFSPDDRTLRVSLGTDDGFRLFVNGEMVKERRVDRGAAPNQDTVDVPLRAGRNSLVLKVVNTGGVSGYYFDAAQGEEVLAEGLVAALLPADALAEHQRSALATAWRRRHSPEFRIAQDELAAKDREREALLAAVPRTMVMKELAEPRPAFVLRRGQYDMPDESRPAARRVPGVLGELPEGAPRDRLGLAQWMTAPDNPLVARVAVNRVWEMVFGTGLVRTSEDFGLQGEWPSHPELLDTLAVDFRESGWDVHALLERIVLSGTYRQASRLRPDVAEFDPDVRLLAWYPRRRLSAEQVRDTALFVSGLLVEEFGGPPVKTYEPPGLWQEVAMLASNTREHVPGSGDDLFRRSVYTYWKRAAPSPVMQTFDAPVREACVVRRLSTNTPLQALAMWNSTQFVEAARALGVRAMRDGAGGDDEGRLARLFTRCTGRAPEPEEIAALASTLGSFRARFADDPGAATELLRVGTVRPPPDLEAAEVAAWTMIASGVLNLHETITQD